MNILFNKKEYIAIGEYFDSSDGLMNYFPEDKSIVTWENFFKNQSNLIKLWALGFLHNHFVNQKYNFQDIYGHSLYRIFEENINSISQFIKRWFDDTGEILNDEFLDFVFGPYSKHGSFSFMKGKEMYEKSVKEDQFFFCNGSILMMTTEKLSWEEIDGKVFIKTTSHNSLCDHIYELLHLLFS
jgi:hypothetical protein